MQGTYTGTYGATPRYVYGQGVQGFVQHHQPLEYGDQLEKPKLQRSRFNLAAICVSLVVPWFLFAFISYVLSFTSYTSPGVGKALVTACFVIVAYFGHLAFMAWKRQIPGKAEHFWYSMLFITSLFAAVAGLSFGSWNYVADMQPYHDVMNLNVYPSVNPQNFTGQQLMDMGRATFVEDSHLDLTKTMGFRNLDTFCVAPIVAGSGAMIAYDFWAVGLNCCSGTQGYSCGEYNNPKALSGLRLMRDDLRPYFRLAVQQAAATHNISAPHPIFMYWMQDPMTEIEAYQDEGHRQYWLGVFSFFVFQLCIVAIATLVASKIA